MRVRGAQMPGADGIVVGGMGRHVHLLDSRNGQQVAALSSELMTAIPARNAVHPSRPIVAGGTASGRVHVFRPPG